MPEVTLVQLNDLHGYMEPHPEWVWSPEGFAYKRMGGLARIKSIVDEVRRGTSDVLFMDNGDTFHGTRAVVESRGECLVPILNRLGLSAMTGHWDFAYGPDHLSALVARLQYPFLAANVYSCEDGRNVFPASTCINLGEVRVGVVGLACNIVDKVMPPKFSTGIRFTNGEEELPRHIEQLRERQGCDLVVLLSHLGLPQDLELMRRVPGVDVCLSGHTHNRLETPIRVGRAVVIQSGCHGSYLGVLRLRLGPQGVEVREHRLVPVDDSVPEDGAVAAVVNATLESSRDTDQKVVGRTSVDLNRATMLESTADNLLLDAMRHVTGAEVGFVNGWRYGAPIPAGEVTVDQLYNLAPMNPPITTVRLRGQEIWDMIEENLERTFSRDPFGQMGGYIKRCGGMRTFFKAENPSGTRVQSIFIGEERLEPDRVYRGAFVTMQAVPDRFGTQREPTAVHLVDALESFLQQHTFDRGFRGSFVEV